MNNNDSGVTWVAAAVFAGVVLSFAHWVWTRERQISSLAGLGLPTCDRNCNHAACRDWRRSHWKN